MKDLSQGPISRHIVEMAAPIAVGLLVQTLYYLVDLYFVGRLGEAALAGVGSAGNLSFVVIGLTQMLGVGTSTLISHAVGRQDRDEANRVFNQSLVLSALCGLLVVAGGYLFAEGYTRSLGADAASAAAGLTYLRWFIPALGLQFALVTMSSALRGTGVVKPTMVVQLLSVLLNLLLAPVLIAGVGTGRPMGVAGAGLASTLAILGGVGLLFFYFFQLEKYVAVHGRLLRPDLTVWRRMFAIGLPAGGEFALLFVYTSVIYLIIRSFGAEAQAGFGVGVRVFQAMLLPAMAIAFAAAPIAGQNFAARRPERVRETFRSCALACSAVMFGLTLFCQWRPALLLGGFTKDPRALQVGTDYLQVIAFNFVCTGIIFTCSSLFQGLGNTWPSLLSSASRVVTFAVPAVLLSRLPGFELRHLWYLSVATITLQCATSLLLLQRELRVKLPLADGAPGQVGDRVG